jgi:UDP-2,3-diacylglucosamine pyrophosphatase LpxH
MLARPGGPRAHDGNVDYLMLSDVHLGSDIVPHLRPWASTSWLLREAAVDSRLVALFDYYRAPRAPGRSWQLIIAGDFLDLVGVSLAAEQVDTPPTAEEVRCGLGSAADHVVKKVHAIAARHPTVFAALANFLAAGNSLVVVRGNHDIELHWRRAQRALMDAIVHHAPVAQREALAARVEICPWFYAVEGVLYVEHGHEFDPMCSYGDPLLPTCLKDPRRIRDTPFSVLLRQVARPTRGLSSASYGYVGMSAYVFLLLQLGVGGSLAIAVRYGRACYRLVTECFARAVDGGIRHVRRAEAQLKRFAKHTGVNPNKLSELRAMYVKPAVQSLNFVMRSLYLDRIFAGLGAIGFALFALIAISWASLTTAGLCALPALPLAAYALIGHHKNTAPTATMRRGAERIAALFQARWVVMGHTHEPVLTSVSPSAKYVNLGSWGQDDPPDEQSETHQTSRTFLVIASEQGGAYRGALLRWDDTLGPMPAECGPNVEPS